MVTTADELRIKALEVAAAYSGAQRPGEVVKRAEAYLAFLTNREQPKPENDNGGTSPTP